MGAAQIIGLYLLVGLVVMGLVLALSQRKRKAFQAAPGTAMKLMVFVMGAAVWPLSLVSALIPPRKD